MSTLRNPQCGHGGGPRQGRALPNTPDWTLGDRTQLTSNNTSQPAMCSFLSGRAIIHTFVDAYAVRQRDCGSALSSQDSEAALTPTLSRPPSSLVKKVFWNEI